MDHAACHVLYVDNRSPRDGYVKRSGAASPGASSVQSGSTGYFDPMLENEEVQENVQNILSTFPGGMLLVQLLYQDSIRETGWS